MKTTFIAELRKVFENRVEVENMQFVGRKFYASLDQYIKVCAYFTDISTHENYNALRIVLINRTQGEIDSLTLNFSDIWGVRSVENPNFKNGIYPSLRMLNSLDWYVYYPTDVDFQLLASAINSYLSVFRRTNQ